VIQPTATIFNTSVFLLGACGILAVLFVRLGFKSWILSIFLGLTSLGAMGVGLFPKTAGLIHPIVSLITFVFAGLSAIR
jgi:hypothetical membrane protein